MILLNGIEIYYIIYYLRFYYMYYLKQILKYISIKLLVIFVLFYTLCCKRWRHQREANGQLLLSYSETKVP